MHKQKTWKCSPCGAEIPDVPMPVLKHQLSHIERRPFAAHRSEGDALGGALLLVAEVDRELEHRVALDADVASCDLCSLHSEGGVIAYSPCNAIARDADDVADIPRSARGKPKAGLGVDLGQHDSCARIPQKFHHLRVEDSFGGGRRRKCTASTAFGRASRPS